MQCKVTGWQQQQQASISLEHAVWSRQCMTSRQPQQMARFITLGHGASWTQPEERLLTNYLLDGSEGLCKLCWLHEPSTARLLWQET